MYQTLQQNMPRPSTPPSRKDKKSLIKMRPEASLLLRRTAAGFRIQSRNPEKTGKVNLHVQFHCQILNSDAIEQLVLDTNAGK